MIDPTKPMSKRTVKNTIFYQRITAIIAEPRCTAIIAERKAPPAAKAEGGE